MKKSKMLVSMVAAVSIIAVSAGCSSTSGQEGGQASPAATSSANVADTVKSITKLKNPNVKVKAYKNYSPSTVPAIGEAVKEFEEKYGGKVEWTEINWGSDFKDLPAGGCRRRCRGFACCRRVPGIPELDGAKLDSTGKFHSEL